MIEREPHQRQAEPPPRQGKADRDTTGRASDLAFEVATRLTSPQPAGAGQALDDATRGELEAKLGEDLGDVRVHTDDRAGASASALEADAYTVGRDIVFGAGKYD